MAGRSAILAVDVIVDAAKAVTGMDDASHAVDRYADSADKASGKTRDVAGSVDDMGGKAGQVTQGMRDLGGALSGMGGTLGKVGVAMEASAVAFEALDGAATLYTVATETATAVTGAFSKAMNFLKVSILTNPIFIVAAIIIGIVAALIIAYQKSETFRAIVDAAFRVVSDAIKTAWEWIKKLADIIGGALVSAWQVVKKAAEIYFDIVTAPLRLLIDLIQKVVDWLGRIKWPSPPDWLSKVGSALGGVFGHAAPAVPMGRAGVGALAAPSVSITVNGALDPDAVARQIRRVFDVADRRSGRAYRVAGQTA